jgi:hypothetical protein
MNKRLVTTVRVLAIGGSLSLAIWLLVSGFVKIADPGPWEESLRDHRLFNGTLLRVVDETVPWVEIAVGLGAVWWLLTARAEMSMVAIGVWFSCLSIYSTALVVMPPPKASSCGCGISQSRRLDWRPLAVQNAGIGSALLLFGFIVPRVRSDQRQDVNERSPTETPPAPPPACR